MNSATCCARSVRGVLAMRPEPERLPCRGCTRDCANYAHCDGRPWRYRSSARGCREQRREERLNSR
jgi:hypothetical protein